MRLIQISDVHFTRSTFNPLRFCSKRIAGMANWFFFRKNWCSHESLHSLPDLFQKLNVDLILVGGDVTTTSLTDEFQDAKDFFDRIKQPKIFIPGNHDQYTKGSHRDQRFYHFFQNRRKTIDHPADFFSLRDHQIEVHPLPASWWCIALDTAMPTSLTSSNGFFSLQTEKYLEEILLSLPSFARVILFNHFPIFDNDFSQHLLINAKRLRALIMRHPKICLYLHGHTHRHAIADLRSNHLPVIVDSGCPIQKPNETWNLIDLQEKKCSVQGFQWHENGWQVFKTASFEWNENESTMV